MAKTATKMQMTTPFSVRLDESLKTKVDNEATLTDRPVSYIIHKALESYISHKEYEREIARADYVKSKKSTEFISDEAMTAWVNSWDTEHELPPPKPDVFVR